MRLGASTGPLVANDHFNARDTVAGKCHETIMMFAPPPPDLILTPQLPSGDYLFILAHRPLGTCFIPYQTTFLRAYVTILQHAGRPRFR